MNTRRRAALLLAWALMLVIPGSAVAQGGPVIPDQPGTERSVLPNGLEIVTVDTGEHDDAGDPSPMQVWLIVRAGAMHELPDERGASRVMERLVRMGTPALPASEIDAILGGGEKDGRPRGSMVIFDQTIFMGEIDHGDPAALDAALDLYAQILGRRESPPDADRFSAARDELIGQLEQALSPELRAHQRWLPELLKGSDLGRHLTLPDADAIMALTPEHIHRFAARTHRPGRAMLLVVGDLGPDGGQEIRRAAGDTLGSIPGGGDAAIIDGRLGIDTAMRAVKGADPELERHQAAMVWFSDDAGDTPRPWSERAAEYTEGDMRRALIERTALEVVRHRLERLSVAELGGDVRIGVDQFELFGRVGVLQIGAGAEPADGDAWRGTLEYLVRQCDRLHRDGATDEEIVRARQSLLARWHREAQGWDAKDNNHKARMAHWLITAGRPMVDMTRWDRHATRVMRGIDDDEIRSALRGMTDPAEAAYIAVVRDDEPTATDPAMRRLVQDAVDNALASPLEEIEENWMHALAGPLLDTPPRPGTVTEIAQHAASGVWSATLSGGVRVHARSLDDGEGRVHISASLRAPDLTDGSIPEREIDAAMVAWERPASESRGGRAFELYMSEHDIRVDTRRPVGAVQLRVDAPAEKLGEAMELLFVLLAEPMIEPGAFERWAEKEAKHEGDPLDRALTMLYRPDRRPDDQASEFMLDDAQRLLSRIVRGGSIEVGIAGPIDQEDAIERAGELLGSLDSPTTTDQASVRDAGSTQPSLKQRRVRVTTGRDHEQGIAIGFVGGPGEAANGSDEGLARLRAMFLASMILDRRLEKLGEQQGFDARLWARVIEADALDGRWALLMRARCGAEGFDAAQRIFEDAAALLQRDGIDAGELAEVQAGLDESLAKYFDTAPYWSARLSTLGLHGRTVEDLWNIRGGYASVDAEQATAVLRETLSGSDRFRIEIEGETARQER